MTNLDRSRITCLTFVALMYLTLCWDPVPDCRYKVFFMDRTYTGQTLCLNGECSKVYHSTWRMMFTDGLCWTERCEPLCVYRFPVAVNPANVESVQLDVP